MIAPLQKKIITPFLVVLVFIQLASVIYYSVFFYYWRYLSAPFVYDKSDTFMDFFHVMYWSDQPGRYTDWGSVYPPINFIFMNFVKMAFVGNLQFTDGFDLRSYSVALQIFIVFCYLAVPAWTMTAKFWSTYAPSQRALFYVFYVLSAPVLFGMERGNVIIFCSLFVATTLSSQGWRKILAIAILINIKPYFAILLLAPAAAGNWREMINIVMLAGAIFTISGIFVDPNFLAFLPNVLSFGQSETIFSGREVLALPSSIAAFAYTLSVMAKEGARLNSGGFDILTISATITWINNAFISLGIITVLIAGRQLSPVKILAILFVLISNLGVWVGGYSMIIYPLLIPAIMTFRTNWICLTLLLLILLPLDMIVLFHETIPTQSVFLSGASTTVEYQLGLGTIVRPLLNLLLLATMCFEVLSTMNIPFARRQTEKAVTI